MPRTIAQVLLFSAAAVLLPTLFHASARADSYTLYTVAQTQTERIVLGDDFGNYAIDVTDRYSQSLYSPATALCGALSASASHCYMTGTAGVAGNGYTTVLPSAAQNPSPKTGMADLPAGPEWAIGRTLGNLFFGSHQGADGSWMRGIWDGSDVLSNYLSNGSIDGGFASTNGNVFFIDGLHDTLVVGIDLDTSPVPEPGSLLLLATGTLSAILPRLHRRRA